MVAEHEGRTTSYLEVTLV